MGCLSIPLTFTTWEFGTPALIETSSSSHRSLPVYFVDSSFLKVILLLPVSSSLRWETPSLHMVSTAPYQERRVTLDLLVTFTS